MSFAGQFKFPNLWGHAVVVWETERRGGSGGGVEVLSRPNHNVGLAARVLPPFFSPPSNSPRVRFGAKLGVLNSLSVSEASRSGYDDSQVSLKDKSGRFHDSSKAEETFRMLSRFHFRKVEDEDVFIVLNDFREKKPHRQKIPHANEAIQVLLGIGLNFQETIKILLRNPVLMSHNPYEHLIPKLCIFLDHGMSSEEVLKAIISDSTIINCTAEHIESTMKYLVDEVQLKNVGRVIRQCPIIVRYGAQSLRPKVEALKIMGVNDVQKAIERYPRVLGYSKIEINRKADLLRNLMETQNIGPLVQTMPLLLGSNSSTSLDTFNWMVSKFSKSSTIQMINQSPGILLMRKDTLEPKLEFICNTMERDVAEVIKTPAVLMYSLEKRMRLRYETLLKYGINKKYSLGHLFCSGTAKFEDLFKVKLLPPHSQEAGDKEDAH